jgi:malonate transporter and related proteins
MLEILAITGPIYAIIAAGFLAGRLGLFDKAAMRALGAFALDFALPALMFRALAERPVAEVFDAGYLFAYSGAALTTLLAVLAYLRLRCGRSMAHAALAGLGSAFGNITFIGYPILLQMVGPVATVALAMSLIADNLLLLPLALLLMEADGAAGGRWYDALGQPLRRTVRNPFVIAIAAGIAWSVLGFKLPGPVSRTLELFANAAIGLALFVAGGALVGLRFRGLWHDVGLVATTKLVVHPLVVGAFVLLGPPMDASLRVAVMTFACIPTLSILPMLAQKHRLEGVCAAALLAAMVASFFTINLALWIFRAVLGWPV